MHAFLKRVPPEIISRCQTNEEYAKDYLGSSQADSETIGVKESWDGLHYLLFPGRRKPQNLWDTSYVWANKDPMGFAIVGKEVLNKNLKYGFGNAKWIDPQTVKVIAAKLKTMDWEMLEDEFDAEKMHECGVYPAELWDDEENAQKFLRYYLLQIRTFYEKAAAQDQAVICYMTM